MQERNDRIDNTLVMLSTVVLMDNELQIIAPALTRRDGAMMVTFDEDKATWMIYFSRLSIDRNYVTAHEVESRPLSEVNFAVPDDVVEIVRAMKGFPPRGPKPPTMHGEVSSGVPTMTITGKTNWS